MGKTTASLSSQVGGPALTLYTWGERGRADFYILYVGVKRAGQQFTYGRQPRSLLRIDSSFKTDVRERLAPTDSIIQRV